MITVQDLDPKESNLLKKQYWIVVASLPSIKPTRHDSKTQAIELAKKQIIKLPHVIFEVCKVTAKVIDIEALIAHAKAPHTPRSRRPN